MILLHRAEGLVHTCFSTLCGRLKQRLDGVEVLHHGLHRRRQVHSHLLGYHSPGGLSGKPVVILEPLFQIAQIRRYEGRIRLSLPQSGEEELPQGIRFPEQLLLLRRGGVLQPALN